MREDSAQLRSVVTFLTATFVMEVGVAAQFTAVGKRVFDIDGQELHLGLLGLVAFVPVAALVLVAGTIADRFDRRRVVAAALVLMATAVAALGAVSQDPTVTIGPILATVGVYAVGRAFLSPAIRALPVNLVAPEDLPRMNALYIGTFQAGLIVGPVVGGLLYAIDIWVPFAMSAVCLVVAGLLVSTVRLHPMHRRTRIVEPASGGRRFSDAIQGLRVIRRQPLLLGAISLDLFAVLFGGAVALLPAIASERLGVGAVGLGWLRAADGIGAAVATVALAIRPLRRRVGPTLFGVVALFGAGTFVLGWTRDYAVAFVALFVLSAADSVSVFIRTTLVPLVTPDEVRGRVGAVENVFIGASNELGAFESGLVGQALGAGPAVMVGGAATIVVAGLWQVLFPAIRRLDAFPRHHTAA